MWPQQQPSSGRTDRAELVSDCASARAKAYPHGVQPSTGVEPHLYSSAKRQDVLSSKEQSSAGCMKNYGDSGACLYDSGRTDSGFLSGANIVSEQCLSSDDISCSRKFTDSALQESVSEDRLEDNSKSRMRLDKEDSMRLDSGVDVNEQFSSLSISPTNDLNSGPSNDLNAPFSKSRSRDSAVATTFTNISPLSPTSKVSLTQPQQSSEQLHHHQQQQPVAAPAWELYYQQDEDGDTQLHIAIIQGFIEVVYALIQMAPHPCFLDIVNYECQSALHLAVLTRQPRIVRRLVVAGATVDIRDRSGNTALHLACLNGDIDCVRALTEPVTVAEETMAGLRYRTYQHHVPQDLEERNYDGQMCIHMAALSGNVEVIKHLVVWCGADINAKDGKSGRTALHLCIELGLAHVARFLVEELATGLQLEAATYAGYTAYQLAAAVDSALARQLREHGAQPRPLPDDEQSDEEDSEDSDAEQMYQVGRDIGFSSLRMNGQPVDITA
ncbi:NF-kappa-B inhibitor cactus isoform X1 [Schistocerca americana]|nr:NF-kappa-B inhibitor cactus isoform X1 [Schistocerca americana]XP_047119202.1 NF-kappa-B inhibitor cactus isoform X1 [Schistocerca piceifrons]XP_049939523.1 NF-kappa-B inhibitor cactus-like isoform X1 [Schistocerca serialis cubense]